MEHKLVPEGAWPGVVKSAEMMVGKSGMKHIRLRISTEHGDVWTLLLPYHRVVRWRYKAQLEALGVDLQLYFEWDGVDLSEHMAEALTLVLPDTECFVYVKHREFRGQRVVATELVPRED